MKKLIIFFKGLSAIFGRPLNFLTSLIYKEKCVICNKVLDSSISSYGLSGCSKTQNILCKTCAKDVEFLSCFPHTNFQGVKIYSACLYKGVVRQLIHKLKFNHKKDVAKVLACFLYEFYRKIEEFNKAENISCLSAENAVLVAVPTNKNNIKQRGYNNVFEIVKEFSNLTNIPYSKNFLLKTKNTKPQYKLTLNKRKLNVSGCFNINIEEYQKFKGKTVVIIDDIYTTGATVREIIKTLKLNNINNFFLITLSKSVQKI